MTDMTALLNAAAQATDEVQTLVGDALRRLEHAFNGRIVNGFGVYSDPSHQRRELHTALVALNAALKRHDATAWPTRADYDAMDDEAVS